MANLLGRFTNFLQRVDSESEKSLFHWKTTSSFSSSFFFSIFCGLSLLLTYMVVTRKRKWRSPETGMTSSTPDIDNGGSSSSSLGCRGYENEYEVFLSFRGPDTRLTITDSLYFALIHAGISVFKDDEELRVGEEIGEELLRAINNSKIYVPIFSRGYASSKWCLHEITHMVECQRKSIDKVILPIFYDVDANDVKLKTPLYRKALQKHRSKSIGKEVKKQWEKALIKVARIKGLNLKDHGLEKLTKLLVEEVCHTLWTRSEQIVPDDLVGIHEPLEKIMRLLGHGASDVRFIVIYGMAGIGKTTLTRLVFNKISSQFQEHCIFLSDVRESSRTVGGIVNLQEKLLSKILNLKSLTIRDVNDGVDMIRQRLKSKKVLIVLDNLDNNDQLEKLAATVSWFGRGSRIIITTRNVDYLVDDEVWPNDGNVLAPVKREDFYFHKMQVMRPNDALKLFSKHAFKSDLLPPDFNDISREVVATTGGLPLAIVVIGPLFRYKAKNLWKDKLEKLKNVVHKDIREKLMISYDDLDHHEKQIFLDIACLFINRDIIDATYYWKARGFFPKCEINVLINKSLIKIVDGNKLWMHELLRDLGRNIVHEENSEIPGKRSRLWSPEEAFDVVWRKKGTEAVIALKLGRVDESCNFTQEQFAGLTNLKFLELDGGNFANGEFNGDFSELIWLSWDNCPEFQATKLSFDSLVILKLSGNHITETWGGWRPILAAKHLEVLNLTRCPCLIRTLGFSTFPTLKTLVFHDCHELKEIDQSIGELKSLNSLTISNDLVNTFQGYSLEMPPRPRLLPDSIGGVKSLTMLKICRAGLTELHPSIGNLVALKHLCLNECPELGNLPSSVGKLTSLLQMDISYSGIKELPDSIGELRQLKRFGAENCELHCLPNSIGRLESLEWLNLSNARITKLPETIGNLKRLSVMVLSDNPIAKLPNAIGKACNLKILRMKRCISMDGEIPEEIGGLSFLTQLFLEGTAIGRVPTTINQLSHLNQLSLGDFDGKLPKLPTSLRNLKLKCSSLDSNRVVDLSNLTSLTHLTLLDHKCRSPNISQPRVTTSMEWLVKLTKLKSLEVVLSGPITLPPDLSSLSQLGDLRITCFDPQHDLTVLPFSLVYFELHYIKLPIKIRCPLLSNLKNVSSFTLNSCWLREIQVDALGKLENLRHLSIQMCELVERLLGLSCLRNLKWLYLSDCPKLIEIQSLEEVKMLDQLDIRNCSSIQSLPDLSSLHSVERLTFANCESLTNVPDINNKETCRLYIKGCAQLGGDCEWGRYHEYVDGEDRGCN